MNTEQWKQQTGENFGLFAFVILATFLIMAGLVWMMVRQTAPPPIGVERAVQRERALAELQTTDFDALENYGWVDQAKGLVRLPIERAMELTVREWQDPAAARANLIARAEAAAAPPPPYE